MDKDSSEVGALAAPRRVALGVHGHVVFICCAAVGVGLRTALTARVRSQVVGGVYALPHRRVYLLQHPTPRTQLFFR
jgi:hypothetical protein